MYRVAVSLAGSLNEIAQQEVKLTRALLMQALVLLTGRLVTRLQGQEQLVQVSNAS